ncbi:MAG TPA: archaemetzincin family Zn-dependent metalloprotease [Thermoanaerobaculia bacterium]|nr:archaemetzincin family Zn-dependent metalloprotease [Thermoanaerobaculia bacterium]
MIGIDIVPMYFNDRDETLRRLGAALERDFRTTVRYRNPWFDPEAAFDSSRGQYRASLLLKALLSDPHEEPATRVLGVTGVDLFTPVLTYVFGEAQLGGRAAVVSSHRLRNEVYGLPPDERLLFERLHKESVHELGHTFGLLHCPNPACVMRASSYAEEIELKAARFCDGCRAIVVGGAAATSGRTAR